MDTINRTLDSLSDKEMPEGLKTLVESDLCRLRNLGFGDDIHVSLNPLGFAVYQHKKPSDFILTTIHNGTYVPNGTPFLKAESERHAREEDLFTGDLYSPVFLEHGGVWVNVFVSRYFADLNRNKAEAILQCDAPAGEKNFVRYNGDGQLIRSAEDYYDSFFATFGIIVGLSSYVLNGHSMNPERGGRIRGDFCVIFSEDQEKNPSGTFDADMIKYGLISEGFHDVRLNDPFTYRKSWMTHNLNPGRTIELETNKALMLDCKLLSKSDSFYSVSKRVTNVLKEYLDVRLQ